MPYYNLSPLQQQIWEEKYKFSTDVKIEDTWHRVAVAVARAEDPSSMKKWASEFFNAMYDFRFIPAGRILSGAGTPRDVTLLNCYVMNNIPDDLDQIYDGVRLGARTMKMGGGIGMDFSTIRPKGALVHSQDTGAAGPLAYMDVYNSMSKTILSAGNREGAMMATLRIDHPDIEEFIGAKREPGRLKQFNVSVLVTDTFINNLNNGVEYWNLNFNGKTIKSVKTRGLWDRLMKATYDVAEPGVIFIDRINDMNNLKGYEEITATNPCGEQPLPPFGSCLLGSLNLSRMIKNPFSSSACLDIQSMVDTTAVAVRFLDNVIDVTKYPLKEQQEEMLSKRRIGLGITGLADAIVMHGLVYGSPESVALTEQIMSLIKETAYRVSKELGKEKGIPSVCAEAGIDRRNSHLLSVAPTGTISLLADNVSNGCEPIFALSYDRTMRLKEGMKTQTTENYAYKLYNRTPLGADANKDMFGVWVTTQNLGPNSHLVIQAAVQKFVDASVSKTVNLPEDISFEKFKDVYLKAYEMGLKGCTTYRPNETRGAVLSVGETASKLPVSEEIVKVADAPTILPKRPQKLLGATYRLLWPGDEYTLFLTINDMVEDGVVRPYEVFIRYDHPGYQAWCSALGRTISAIYRRGGPINFVGEELTRIFDPRGGQRIGAKFVPSQLAMIGTTLIEHASALHVDGSIPPGTEVKSNHGGQECPRCGYPDVSKEGGCDICKNCGYSSC